MLETVHTVKRACSINHLLTISTTAIYNPISFNSPKVSEFILRWIRTKNEAKNKIPQNGNHSSVVKAFFSVTLERDTSACIKAFRKLLLDLKTTQVNAKLLILLLAAKQLPVTPLSL